MKLTELNPRWVSYGGEGHFDRDRNPIPFRDGVGVSFDCPCGCPQRCYVDFANPLDGGPPIGDAQSAWQNTGGSFETLTLRPSLLRPRDAGLCGWHGFITHGEVTGQIEG